MVIPHAGPTTPTYFYTFTTVEGHTLSLTDSHYIVIVINDEKKMTTICASEVTLEHQLVMTGRTIGLEKIVYSERIGFYAPITISGYLLVNNLSTSAYIDYFHGTHDFHHRIVGSMRIYYRLTKWLFGNDYKPFGTSVKEELHPVSFFIIAIHDLVRLVFAGVPFMILLMSTFLMIYLTQRKLYGTEHYHLRIMCYMDK